MLNKLKRGVKYIIKKIKRGVEIVAKSINDAKCAIAKTVETCINVYNDIQKTKLDMVKSAGSMLKNDSGRVKLGYFIICAGLGLGSGLILSGKLE